MKKRVFGKTGIKVSEVGLGTWQLGTDWGEVTEEESLSVLSDAIDKGVTFIDTADVYGAGRSEMSIGKVLKKRKEKLFVASKVGRWHNPGWPENLTLDNMRIQIENSLERLDLDVLDLIQL
ncbi:MAG: aldo/keto reductase, partial [Gammaproteobacteria bacterium]